MPERAAGGGAPFSVLSARHTVAAEETYVTARAQEEYSALRATIRERDLASRTPNLLASTVFGKLAARELVAWVMEDALPVRVQLQMHKYIWAPDTQGV